MTARLSALLRSRLSGPNRDRGDVPGWVLVTIMTAGIVVVLWQFAEPYLTSVLKSALDTTVKG